MLIKVDNKQCSRTSLACPSFKSPKEQFLHRLTITQHQHWLSVQVQSSSEFHNSVVTFNSSYSVFKPPPTKSMQLNSCRWRVFKTIMWSRRAACQTYLGLRGHDGLRESEERKGQVGETILETLHIGVTLSQLQQTPSQIKDHGQIFLTFLRKSKSLIPWYLLGLGALMCSLKQTPNWVTVRFNTQVDLTLSSLYKVIDLPWIYTEASEALTQLFHASAFKNKHSILIYACVCGPH